MKDWHKGGDEEGGLQGVCQDSLIPLIFNKTYIQGMPLLVYSLKQKCLFLFWFWEDFFTFSYSDPVPKELRKAVVGVGGSTRIDVC